MRQTKAFIESHGGYFEHFLIIYSVSCNSQIKCFTTQADMNIISCFGMWNSCSVLSTPVSYTLYACAHTSVRTRAHTHTHTSLSLSLSLSHTLQINLEGEDNHLAL
jgi:hypothetical protein